VIEDYGDRQVKFGSFSSRAVATIATPWDAARRVGDAQLLWHGDHR